MAQTTEIISMLIYPTSTYHDQAAYSYGTHVTPNLMSQIQERTYGGTSINPGSFQGIAGEMFTLDPSTQRAVSIANGYTSQRLRFVMQVQVKSAASSTRYIYSGYTDHYGYSQGGHVDPNMQLYFNNCISVSQVQYPSPQGLQVSTVVNDCTHILHQNLMCQAPNFQQVFNNDPFNNQMSPVSLTPSNVLHNLSFQGDYQLMADMSNFMGHGQAPVFDTRTDLTLGKSRRSDAIPVNYLHQTAKAYGESTKIVDRATAQLSDVYNNAAGALSSSNVYSDRFLNTLITNFDYQLRGYITWRDLASQHPEIDHPDITKIVVPEAPILRQMGHLHENYNPNIGDHRPETLLINRLAQSITPLLLENLISQCSLSATNMVLNGQFDIQITNVGQYVGIPQGALMERVDRLKAMIGNLIFGDLGNYNEAPMSLQMSIDAFGETHAQIMYNGGPYEHYVLPTFTDAASSMMLAPSKQPLDNISNDIGTVLNTLF